MSTAFDAESLAFLATLDMPTIKIPSGDITCGPLLLQDFHLIEKLQHFNRERIPERVVHAKGSGAFGTLQDWSATHAFPAAPAEEPVPDLSDADGWGPAMRQNSPFAVVLR